MVNLKVKNLSDVTMDNQQPSTCPKGGEGSETRNLSVVECLICKKEFRSLEKHLPKHEIDKAGYLKIYPNAKMCSEEISNRRASHGSKGGLSNFDHGVYFKRRWNDDYEGFKKVVSVNRESSYSEESNSRRSDTVKKNWTSLSDHDKAKKVANGTAAIASTPSRVKRNEAYRIKLSDLRQNDPKGYSDLVFRMTRSKARGFDSGLEKECYDKLNNVGVSFEYNNGAMTLPSGRVTVIDFYLKGKKTFIETKGMYWLVKYDLVKVQQTRDYLISRGFNYILLVDSVDCLSEMLDKVSTSGPQFLCNVDFDDIVRTSAKVEDGGIKSSPITKCKWSTQAQLAASSHLDLDIPDVLTNLVASFIKQERDMLLINGIQAVATPDSNLDFNATPPTNYSKLAKYAEIELKLNYAESATQYTNGRGGVSWILCGNNAADIWRNAASFVPSGVVAPIGPHSIGTLRDGTVEVIKVPFMDKNKYITGFKGYVVGDAATIMAEWIPLYASPTFQAPDLNQYQGMMSLYAIVQNNVSYYKSGTVSGYVA